MISISTLYCGHPTQSHQLRYGRPADRPAGPVMVFNCTDRCNLRCRHCYAAGRCGGEELSTAEAMALLEDFARAGVPVVLFSGGEPLLRDDLPELLDHVAKLGMRGVISTNGTLITPQMAGRLAGCKLAYAGVSIDGPAELHDQFRQAPGAFDAAMQGLANAKAAGIKVGLRMTLTRHNAAHVGEVFDLLERQGIPRVCFYHLVYTGRGGDLRAEDLSHAQRRAALDVILERTAAAHAAGNKLDVLTVDNHADGAYVYLRLLARDPAGAEKALEMLRINGGNSSGERIGCVTPSGTVLPDQFWQTRPLGNVRERKFSEIWNDPQNQFLRDLRRRPRPLAGRCRQCRFLDICNGNFRARAEQATGDIWGNDPACYLTEEEIA